MATIAEVARTLKNIALGASPWAPGQGNYGVGGFTADELTAALASGVPGARVEAVDVHAADAMTTDHAHLALTWNETGRAASLPAKLFTKGTPAAASTRILNSAFDLCQNEVRFYTELYPAVAAITLTPHAPASAVAAGSPSHWPPSGRTRRRSSNSARRFRSRTRRPSSTHSPNSMPRTGIHPGSPETSTG